MRAHIIPVEVNSEERLVIPAFRVELKWADPNNRTQEEIDKGIASWSEYFMDASFYLEEFKKRAQETFGPEYEILKVEEIKITAW